MRPTVQDCFIPQNYTSSPEVIKNCLQEVLEQRILKPQAGEPDNEDMTKKETRTDYQGTHGKIHN
jgi:hypothetical protein